MTPPTPAASIPPAHRAETAGHLARGALWATLAAAFLGWMFDGVEMGIFPLVARPALQDMHQHLGAAVAGEAFVGLWMGRITALFLLGAACGGVIFGWIGDRFGRVRAMTLSVLVYSCCTGLGYFATAPWHLGVFRFAAALGMGGEWALGVALVMETWPRRWRAALAGLIGAIGNVGFLLVGVIGLHWRVSQASWRWLMLVGAAPALLTLFIRLFVPESERWAGYVRAHGAPRPLTEIFSPALLRRTVLAIVLSSVALIGTWGSVQWLPLWADQLAGPAHPEAKALTQMLSALGSVFGCLFGAALGAWAGRRPAYFWLCAGSLAICAALYRGGYAYGQAFLGMSFAVGAITAAFYGWLPLYLPELFPTHVRATAQGLAYNSGRVLAAAGAVSMGQMMQSGRTGYAQAGANVTLVYLLGLVAILFAPETKGQRLED